VRYPNARFVVAGVIRPSNKMHSTVVIDNVKEIGRLKRGFFEIESTREIA